MQEIFPVAAGAIVGGLVLLIKTQWLRAAAFVVGCLVFGFLASWLSGELEESWGFLSIDMALVWVGGLVSVVIISAIRYFWTARRANPASGRGPKRD